MRTFAIATVHGKVPSWNNHIIISIDFITQITNITRTLASSSSTCNFPTHCDYIYTNKSLIHKIFGASKPHKPCVYTSYWWIEKISSCLKF